MKQRILFVLLVFFGFLPFFVIQKPLFMLYNHVLCADCSWVDYLRVIGHGLVLDASISGYLTIFPILCALVSVWLPGRYLSFALKGYFTIVAFLISFLFVLDEGLYAFWGFRLDTTAFFYMQSPKDSIASVPGWTFLLQSVTFLTYGFVMQWFFRKWIVPVLPPTHLKRRMPCAIALVLLGGLLFIPIRGSVTTSTANVGMVYFSDRQFLNHAAINPCFSLLASISKQQDFSDQYDFFPEEKRKELFMALTTPDLSIKPDTALSGKDSPFGTKDSLPLGRTEGLLRTQRPNILLILLESFTANAIEAVGGEPGVTPYLNQLGKEGIVFMNCYANSFRTDRGLVAVLDGYPAQPTTSIMKYPAKSQTLPSLAKSLDAEGYTSDMLYGGDINFTNMQSYFYSTGYSKITSDRNFPIQTRLNKWGANDDVTFKYLYTELVKRKTETPWFTTFLTLSSHEPFKVPYQRLAHPFLNSVAFTDSCLGDFIGRLKATPLWANTLIILVADHGFRYPDNLEEFEPRRFHIPMIWAGGALKGPRTIDTYMNQTDLAATLLNQLGIQHHQFSFSKDIMDGRYPQYAFYTFPNGFGFIDTTGASVYDCTGEKILYQTPDTHSSERLDKGKALLQTLYDDLGRR